jgi:predicted RNA-binding protein YlxR (DUF448 family)
MAKQRHRPVRTCVACRQEAGKAELVRIVRRPEGGVEVEVDRQGRLAGRGAYLHASNECLETARKRRALERALGIHVPPEFWVELRPSSRRAAGAQVSNSPGPA